MSKHDKDSVALGHVRQLPLADEKPAPIEDKLEVLDSPEDFRMAIGRAQMDGIDHVEVTEKLFNFLVRNQKTNYLTYGDPGIKVFKVGTRDQILLEEKMTAEQHTDHMAKKRAMGQLV